MAQRIRNQHFVPQAYLRQWSEDGRTIWCYRLLVSHAGVPAWEQRSIERTASWLDLYTGIVDGEETDEFERWMAEEVEAPVAEVLNKVARDQPLTTADWERLILLFALQDLRTPAAYVEARQRWDPEMESTLTAVLQRSVEELQRAREGGRTLPQPPPAPEDMRDVLKVEVRPATNSEHEGMGEIRAEVTVGRKLWHAQIRLLMSGEALQHLMRHEWRIVHPCPGTGWFTSDHPVIKLNFNAEDAYDLLGGWGSPGTDLAMPLSPSHLLHTQIDRHQADHDTLSPEQTRIMQKMIAERAFRWIFAHKRMRKAEWLRPRWVNAEAFTFEEQQRAEWSDDQRRAELDGV